MRVLSQRRGVIRPAIFEHDDVIAVGAREEGTLAIVKLSQSNDSEQL
jgi:hypothetical protein